LELRQHLNAQGRGDGIEDWAKWCKKHFSCDVRTVNRALSDILGPENAHSIPEGGNYDGILRLFVAL
jgi:hypothetical protein